MYKCLHHEVLTRLSQTAVSLSIYFCLASTCFFLNDYKGMFWECFEYIVLVVTVLPSACGKSIII